jgi:hypothetical protein
MAGGTSSIFNAGTDDETDVVATTTQSETVGQLRSESFLTPDCVSGKRWVGRS